MITTGAFGFPESVPDPSIFLTRSIPEVTSPNTTWRSSSHGQSTVVMKNLNDDSRGEMKQDNKKRKGNKNKEQCIFLLNYLHEVQSFGIQSHKSNERDMSEVYYL